MTNRIYTTFVFGAWLASMSWLFVAKIWPTLYGGDPPDYTASIRADSETAQTTVWHIFWKDRRIGRAASKAIPRASGTAMRYVVQFEQLPLEMMLSESFGVFGAILFPDRTTHQPATSDRGPGKYFESLSGFRESKDRAWELDLLLATEMRFNTHKEFTGFRTVGELPKLSGQFVIEGKVEPPRKLVLITQIPTPFGGATKPLRHELDLPADAVVTDAFAPRSELKNLHVGQKWTIPVYRPFPPNSPVQIIAAHAERHELMLWDGRDVETILVVYYDEAGSGLISTREPIAREWVRDDGLVLQQEVRWSGAVIRFERQPESAREAMDDLLSNEANPGLWNKA